MYSRWLCSILVLSSVVAVLIVGTAMLLPGCVPVDGPNGDGDGNGDGNGDVPPEVEGLPLATFETDNFVGSGTCAVCHGGLVDSNGEDVSIDTDWRVAMMANGAKDPFFLALVSSEVERAPGLRDTIEDVCAKCHMPMAHTQAVADGTPVRMFDDGFLSDENPLHEAASDGVSCTLCHQIQDAFVEDPEGGFNGEYQIDTETPEPDRPIFGPYLEPQQPELMRSAVGYTPTFGEHLTQSGLCATCHTLFTPTLDADGQVVGEFPEQTPYLEWQHSGFGDGVGEDQQCQDCHMPVADGAVAISRVPSDLDGRQPFYQHQFLGGNVFMLRLLRDNIEELGLTASTAQFNEGIARTEAFLGNETADLTIADAGQDGDTLTVTLEVANKTGHKFPTSFPSRRAWIHLTVTDGAGAVIFESGAPQADGSVAGDDADADAAAYERHHDVITGDDQVQVYQAIMADTDGQVTYTLLRAAAYAKDNRLLPAGFDKATSEAAIAVAGLAADDANFMAGSDQVTYQIDTTGHAGPFTVEAELLYESLSYRFAADLLEETTPLIDAFSALYAAADKTPTVVAQMEQLIP